MNRLELRMEYKKDTSDGVDEFKICAHASTRHPDIVICEELLSDKAMASIHKFGYFELGDTDYINWLEEKVMELLTK